MTLLQTPIVRDVTAEQAPYRGLAFTQMGILKSYMKVAGLNVYSRVVTLANGVVITCKVCFNREDIHIYVPPVAAFTEEIVRVEEEKWSGVQVNANGERKMLEWTTAGWKSRLDKQTEVRGNIDWKGRDGCVLSWRGVPSRYWNGDCFHQQYPGEPYLGKCFGSLDPSDPAPAPFSEVKFVKKVTGATIYTEKLNNHLIYRGNETIEVLRQADPLLPDEPRLPVYRVLGAAICAHKMVIVANPVEGTGASTIFQDVVIFANEDGTGQRGYQVVFESFVGQSIRTRDETPWFFNGSGTRAVATRRFLVGGVLETHKMYLDIDTVNETATLTDTGICASVETVETTTVEYSNSLTATGEYINGFNGVWLFDAPSLREHYLGKTSATTTIETTIANTVFDFVGDVEVSLQFSFSHSNSSTTASFVNSYVPISADQGYVGTRLSEVEYIYTANANYYVYPVGTTIYLGQGYPAEYKTNQLASVDITLNGSSSFARELVSSNNKYQNNYIDINKKYFLLGISDWPIIGNFIRCCDLRKGFVFIAFQTNSELGEWNPTTKYNANKEVRHFIGPVGAVVESLYSATPYYSASLPSIGLTTRLFPSYCATDTYNVLMGQYNFEAVSGNAAMSINKIPHILLATNYTFVNQVEGGSMEALTSVPCAPITAASEFKVTTTTTAPDGQETVAIEYFPQPL